MQILGISEGGDFTSYLDAQAIQKADEQWFKRNPDCQHQIRHIDPSELPPGFPEDIDYETWKFGIVERHDPSATETSERRAFVSTDEVNEYDFPIKCSDFGEEFVGRVLWAYQDYDMRIERGTFTLVNSFMND